MQVNKNYVGTYLLNLAGAEGRTQLWSLLTESSPEFAIT
jgi:hypothetical protein